MKRITIHSAAKRKSVEHYRQQPNPKGNRHQRRAAKAAQRKPPSEPRS